MTENKEPSIVESTRVLLIAPNTARVDSPDPVHSASFHLVEHLRLPARGKFRLFVCRYSAEESIKKKINIFNAVLLLCLLIVNLKECIAHAS